MPKEFLSLHLLIVNYNYENYISINKLKKKTWERNYSLAVKIQITLKALIQNETEVLQSSYKNFQLKAI